MNSTRTSAVLRPFRATATEKRSRSPRGRSRGSSLTNLMLTRGQAARTRCFQSARARAREALGGEPPVVADRGLVEPACVVEQHAAGVEAWDRGQHGALAAPHPL